jgi:hypothetical protein
MGKFRILRPGGDPGLGGDPFLRTLNCVRLATMKAMNGTTFLSCDFQDRAGRADGSQVESVGAGE